MLAPGPRLRFALPLLAFITLNAATSAPAGDFDADRWAAKVDPPTTPVAKPGSTDFAIPFPANFGGGGEVVYPTSPSSFVVIGKNFFPQDVRQVFDLSTKKLVGTFKGQLGLDDKTVALSPDGAYLAGKDGRKVVVRNVKNGRIIQTFEVETPFLDYVDFGAGDRLIFGRLRDRKLEVADIKTGDKVADLTLVKEVDREAIAFSPGRAYLAAASDDGSVRVYATADGRVVGEAPGPKRDGHAIKCVGLAYSNDGAELAGLFEWFGSYRIVAWNAGSGKSLADFDLGKTVQKPAFYADQGIGYLPDRTAWLVLGYALVDRAVGQKVWNLPFDAKNLKPGPRRFLDADHALVITHEPSLALRTASIPRDKVANAARIAASGGNAADAALPPLKPADWSGVKKVAAPAAAVAWGVKPEAVPAPRRLTSKGLPLAHKPDDYRALLFLGTGSTEVVAVGTPKQLGQPNPYEGQERWVERFDLAGGKVLGQVDLPDVADPIAVGPEGRSVLIRESKARDRVDLFDLATGKPLVGWRPFERERGDDRVVAWAGFVAEDRVLTLGGGGTLVLWSVPDCKALYSVDDAFRGEPTLSPGRRSVAGFDGRSLRVLDALTGQAVGESPLPANLQRTEVKGIAYRPDAKELVALFANGSLVGFDLATGRGAEVKPTMPVPTLGPIEWAGADHVLLDHRLLLDLGSKRPVGHYAGSPLGAVGPDGRHWFVARGVAGKSEGSLAAIELPDAATDQAENRLDDARSPAVIRPGSKVSIQLAMAGPPKDAPAYLRGLTDALAAQLRANGLVVVDDGGLAPRPNVALASFGPNANAAGPAARLVVTVREKDTGKTVEYRRMGALPRNVQVVKLVDLIVELSLADASGVVTWQPAHPIPLQPPGFILHMPAGEDDPEVYLKKFQWDRVKEYALNVGCPYFVSREGAGTIFLPSRVDLNAIPMK